MKFVIRYLKVFLKIMLIILILYLLLNKSNIEGIQKFLKDKKVCNELYVNKNNKKVFVFKKLLSSDMCKSIIREGEDYAKFNGWTTKRHESYPTTDNEITSEWNTYNYISNKVHDVLFMKLQEMYNVDKNELGINELFIAKYQFRKNKQKGLKKHTDGSEFSFIISLNDNFKGGGTYFTELDKKYHLAQGDCILFSGQNPHKGIDVTEGTRYILTGFINYMSQDYCQDLLTKN